MIHLRRSDGRVCVQYGIPFNPVEKGGPVAAGGSIELISDR